jgi:hypothetical protein
MKTLALGFFIAFCPVISALASPTPAADVDQLIHDKVFAASHIQHFLDAVYKDGNTQLVDNSLFSSYSSGNSPLFNRQSLYYVLQRKYPATNPRHSLGS